MRRLLYRMANAGRKLCFWRRKERPSVSTMTREDMEQVLRSTLERERRHLREEVAGAMREQLTAFLEPLHELREAAAELRRDVREGLEGLGAAISALGQSLEPRLADLEESGKTVDEALRHLNGSAGQLNERLDRQFHGFEKHIETTRQSLAALERASDRRVRELAQGHEQEKQFLLRDKERQRRESEKQRSFIDQRLRLAAVQIEGIAERLGPGAPEPASPPPAGQSRLARSARWLGAPIARFRRRLELARQLAEMRRHLSLEQENLGLLKAELRSLSHSAGAADLVVSGGFSRTAETLRAGGLQRVTPGNGRGLAARVAETVS